MEQVFKVGFINSTKQLIDCALSVAAKLNLGANGCIAILSICKYLSCQLEQCCVFG